MAFVDWHFEVFGKQSMFAKSSKCYLKIQSTIGEHLLVAITKNNPFSQNATPGKIIKPGFLFLSLLLRVLIKKPNTQSVQSSRLFDYVPNFLSKKLISSITIQTLKSKRLAFVSIAASTNSAKNRKQRLRSQTLRTGPLPARH